MKTKILALALIVLTAISCKDFLNVTSEAQLDSAYIFGNTKDAEMAVLGALGLWGQSGAGTHSNGLFYDIMNSSDTELGPEAPTSMDRYRASNLYANGNYTVGATVGAWNNQFAIVNRANLVLAGIEESAMYQDADKNTPSLITHLYGEMICLRANVYYELSRIYGDVPYSTRPFESADQINGVGVVDRNIIQDGEIEALIAAEPGMFTIGQEGMTAERMTRGFAQGLIARLCLVRGGYALRPTGYELQSGDEVIQQDGTWGKMVRRGDWRSYYTTAQTYLERCRDTSGARLVTNDSREGAFKNPFQLVFQQMMNGAEVGPESVYEVPQYPGVQNERPYAFGRPSATSSTSAGHPTKNYGQIRFYPTFYYGEFHPKDMRRDVTATVTLNTGTGSEMLVSLLKGNMVNGGIVLNKWDMSRMKEPARNPSRNSGINAPYMRMGDILLLLAEVYAVNGNDGAAKTELLKVRGRAFDPADPDYAANVTNYVNGLSGDALLTAIQNERKFELAGEGTRKYDLVRWGLFGQAINSLQQRMDAMIAGLQNSGSYTFENGNTISTQIYTKNWKWAETKPLGLTDMLTGNTNVAESHPLYPVLFPGWRGNYSSWPESGGIPATNDDNWNLAIKGLFKPLSSAEIAAATADGYAAAPWGATLIDPNVKEMWTSGPNGIFGGYLFSDFSAGKPPRYLLPIPATEIAKAKGALKNEYGFPDDF